MHGASDRRLDSGPAFAAQAALALLMLVPWFWAHTPGPSPNTAPLLVAWTCMALALLLCGLLRLALPRERTLAAIWCAAAAGNAVIALLQCFGVLPDLAWLSPARLGEAYGNLRQRNQFASLTSLGLAALVFLPPRRGRAWVLAAILLLAAANAVSTSRTGFVQWVAIAALAALWPGPRLQRLAWCAIALLAYGAGAVLLPALFEIVHGIPFANALDRALTDLGCSSRKVLWSNVLHLVAQHPWAGWGWGELDYAHFATLYPGDRFCDILDNAHNLPLHLAVEFGVPLAVAATLAMLVLLWQSRPWREADAGRQLAWAGLAVIGLHSLVEYPLWYGPFQLTAMLCLAALLPAGAGARWRRAGMGAALVALVAFGVVWRDYTTVSQAFLPAEARRPHARVDPVRAAGTPLVFRAQLRFAELSVTPLSRANAAHVHRLALDVLHYSPEPMVIEKAANAALVLGRDEDVLWLAARYRAAFPERYRQWIAAGPMAP